ncbi:phosphoribosyl-AMP cyclohydrolase [Candidatus Albibeggiatoa sp. nov. NOAA]|uniref:phosphoribosyl-AMP cyclohydrolase n=1 Tax=Candidatus Albibeggiatoa sp. nov. NOAA TaxID=3162724 RepID=UPI003303C054|nr:phosphoribosyl-AMP cyclohydrolase [Thiotrichaceae bacterium]
MTNWLDQVAWDDNGLVPVIAQDAETNTVLMMAWMNQEALRLTVEQQRAVYWSRSRQKLWFKGEESGNVQKLKSIHLDCDHDVILLKVEQIGGVACHTGRQHCFFRKLENDEWVITESVLKDPATMYKKS